MNTVQLFVTCLVDSFYPKTGTAVVDILRRLGTDVEFAPDQTCCGQAIFNAGLRDEARPSVEHTIRVFEKTTGDIVIPSGSCAHMIKHGYIELFAEDPVWLARAQSLASRVYEFTEFIVDKIGVTDLGAHWEGTLTYHPSCHTLRAMNIDRQPRALLENVKGANIVELPEAESCCGFGGIFSMEHPELSAEWLKRKISNLDQTQSNTLVVTESGCLLHIAGGLHRQKKQQKVIHIAELLNHR
ncbi:MAG TPA: Fe-S oxidoreductase [Anaerolineae bacterium]|nr:Fe-S oxidoreductase [Anaerolineae bacterium]